MLLPAPAPANRVFPAAGAAELGRESVEWPGSTAPPVSRKWWEAEASPWQSQWGHTNRNAEGLHAVRAMVLYPLNALVEDQLRRLRQTLDSDSVLRWMDAQRAGNRVTFGRYTGATPVSGFPGNEAAVRRLRERLRNIADESDSVRDDPDLPWDARVLFPKHRWWRDVVALGYARNTARHSHYQLPHVEHHAYAAGGSGNVRQDPGLVAVRPG